MSGKDKLNSKADPTITLIVGNSITRDVILLCATNCVLHERQQHGIQTAWAYREIHKRSRTSDDFLWSLALQPRAFGSSHASTHNLLMTTTLPHDLWWYKSNKKPTLVTFTAALPCALARSLSHFTAYWKRARLFMVYIQTQPRTTAIMSRMPYIFASVRRFMTGQVVPDFDQSRFRLSHSLLFLLCLILLNPFKEHVSIYYTRASPA